MQKKIVIVSSCTEDWGGSEELWGKSVPYLQSAGYSVTVVKYFINRSHPEFVKLASSNAKLIEIYPKGSIPVRIKKKLFRSAENLAKSLRLVGPKPEDFSNFHQIMHKEKPTLVIISQGINFDGLKLAYQCLLLKIPYVVVSQKAVDFYWPHKDDRSFMLKSLLEAERAFFVSQHNLRLTEEQFGARLINGAVIFNPVKTSGGPIPFPSAHSFFKLACVGRLFLLDKGQDLLIRILSKQKWQERPISISLVGKGTDEDALRDMAKLLLVENINFIGHIENIEEVWKDHHALILPSRSEGLPLSMVEAMAAGRPVIISDAGGNTELVEEGITGFIGSAHEKSFEEAMERAWDRRHEWGEIGKKAAQFIEKNVPQFPEKIFSEQVLEIANKLAQHGR